MNGDGDVVLVVDDSVSKRYLLVNWLTRAGFEVHEAKSGAEALERIGTEPVDVVVLDVRLPDMSGFEVCERIKGDPRFAALPVIHVSAHAVDVSDRTEGLNRGADGYLVEPIDPMELIAQIRAVLRYYRALQRAELLAERLSLLAETTLRINSATDMTTLVRAAAEGAARIFHSPAVVLAESVDGACLAGVAVDPPAESVVRTWSLDDPEVPVGSTLRVDDRARWDLVTWPAAHDRRRRVAGAAALEGQPDDGVSVVAARLRADRAPVYVAVWHGHTAPGAPVLSQLGQAVAAAVEAQRSYDEEHRIAITLQRSLLPQRVADVPGVDSAVRYEPASRHAEIGGDFYELRMIDGKLLVAIGDVAGHSLHAATVMAKVRHAVLAYAMDGHPPGDILERINRLMCHLLPGELATVCLLTVDPADGSVRLANAGHPPPLIISDGGTHFVRHHGALLGVAAHRPDDLELTLPAGATLVLYTDGLVEKRSNEIDDGLAALAAAAATVEQDLDEFCGRLLAGQAGPDPEDDIALVALRWRGTDGEPPERDTPDQVDARPSRSRIQAATNASSRQES